MGQTSSVGWDMVDTWQAKDAVRNELRQRRDLTYRQKIRIQNYMYNNIDRRSRDQPMVPDQELNRLFRPQRSVNIQVATFYNPRNPINMSILPSALPNDPTNILPSPSTANSSSGLPALVNLLPQKDIPTVKPGRVIAPPLPVPIMPVQSVPVITPLPVQPLPVSPSAVIPVVVELKRPLVSSLAVPTSLRRSTRKRQIPERYQPGK